MLLVSKIIKRLACSFFILLLPLFLSACSAELSDWIYELPNNYEILCVDSKEIVLGKKDGNELDYAIKRYITEFCYNEAYIGIKRIPVDENNPDQEVDMEQFDHDDLEYYIIDVTNDEIYGPYKTIGQYEEMSEALGVGNMSDWINTDDYS